MIAPFVLGTSHTAPLWGREENTMVAPLIRDTIPGIYQICENENTDYAIPIPPTAKACMIWFETSESDPAMIGGRVGFDEEDDPVTGLDNEDTVLGYHPPMPVIYPISGRRSSATVLYERDRFMHVASAIAGAAVYGMWLFDSDNVPS